ncbi:MAG: ABC transporter permease [Nitrospiraceae bacterium]|nr:ABC transporter permease [Nitrospiraceae bacterium]
MCLPDARAATQDRPYTLESPNLVIGSDGNMIRLLAVIERDLKKFRRNPVVLGMSILMPIIYLLILGNSFQGKLTSLPVAVVNHDTGPFAKRVVENLTAIAAGPQTFRLVIMQDDNKAVEGVRNGRYKAALIIPEDFDTRVTLKGRPEVGLFLDNTDGISAETIRNLVSAALGPIHDEYVPIREKTTGVLIRDVNLYPKVDYYQSLVPGVVIMAIFLGTLTTGAFNLVMDRFMGIDESYLLTPLSKSHIVAGLIISGLSITTVIATLIFVVSVLITGIPLSRGVHQCVSLFIIIVLTTLCLLSLMFLILGRVGHPRIVGILSGFLNVILFFPSGAVYPVASFPGWLRSFAKINPEAYAVDALKSVLFKNAGLATISGDIAFLALFTAIMMTLSIITFKRTL